MSSFALIHCRGQSGILAPPVTVETHITGGLPRFNIVGLAETAVKESRDRVRSAIINSHFDFPIRHITVNLAPADIPKEGGRFDLAIALGILAASGQIPKDNLSGFEFAGELALSGALRTIKGSLPFALATYNAKRQLILPTKNAKEAGLISDLTLYPAKHLLEVCQFLRDNTALTAFKSTSTHSSKHSKPTLDLEDIRGQQQAKRALEIAASGGHSLLLIGPPGTGKTMLASCLPSILPTLEVKTALQVAAINSISQSGFNLSTWQQRPFRSPHHTTSSVALVGGGNPPRPGEISLAHHGVLFLDELPQFNRHVLESLREPLEEKTITISRANYQVSFPANFQLIAAMNPCPCGYQGDQQRQCRCSPDQIQRYHNKLSGPLLDRIDMHVEVPTLNYDVLLNKNESNTETSTTIQARIEQIRQRQIIRQNQSNAELNNQQLEQVCQLNTINKQWLQRALTQLKLSARAYHRILKLSRTIADLVQSDKVEIEHLAEAINYRKLDRLFK